MQAFETGKHPTGMLQAIIASLAAKEGIPERKSVRSGFDQQEARRRNTLGAKLTLSQC